MATIEQYEDIQGWQKARELTKFVYLNRPAGQRVAALPYKKRVGIVWGSHLQPGSQFPASASVEGKTSAKKPDQAIVGTITANMALRRWWETVP